MVLVQLALSMQKNANQSFLISLYKAQVQLDQRPSHKTRYTESNRRESGEELRTHRHTEKCPEQNTNGLCSKIINLQLRYHEIAKILSIGQNGNQQIGEKIFANPTSVRGLISNIYKELKKLDYRESIPFKNGVQS